MSLTTKRKDVFHGHGQEADQEELLEDAEADQAHPRQEVEQEQEKDQNPLAAGPASELEAGSSPGARH